MTKRHRKLGPVKNELIQKSIESMLAVVQIFNNPNSQFKSESFIVLAITAWTYLLHAHYRNKKMEYRYCEKKGQRKKFDRTLKMGLTLGNPEIINSDQGSQFTSDDWIHALREYAIKISMTGKGRCKDNIYIERFWCSFKQEEFYLNEYTNVKELRKTIAAYIEFYNHKRWHQSLDYKRPADVYFEQERKLLLT